MVRKAPRSNSIIRPLCQTRLCQFAWATLVFWRPTLSDRVVKSSSFDDQGRGRQLVAFFFYRKRICERPDATPPSAVTEAIGEGGREKWLRAHSFSGAHACGRAPESFSLGRPDSSSFYLGLGNPSRGRYVFSDPIAGNSSCGGNVGPVSFDVRKGRKGGN